MSKRPLLLILPFAVLLIVGGTAFAFRAAVKERTYALSKPALPPARTYAQVIPPVSGAAPSEPAQEPSPDTSNVRRQTSKVQVDEINLAVPFTPQAPHADWGLPYQEACEEASLIMANGYLAGVSSFTPDEADRQILALIDWEKKRFGYYENTTAEETATMAREYFGHNASRALPLSSMDEVKAQLHKGNVVLLPAAGRLLGNPFFSGQGPIYHMLLVKGYTKDGRIITNDPGTRRGADYVYDPAVLFNAVHDWNAVDITQGAKMMIVVEK